MCAYARMVARFLVAICLFYENFLSGANLGSRKPLQIATGIHVVYMLFQNALGLMEFGNSFLDQSFGKARV